MKIVFMEADTYGDDIDLTKFSQLGEVEIYPETDPEKNPHRIKDADVVVVNKTLMNEPTLKLASNLKLIAVAATGTNNVDFDYVNKRGIKVCNVGGYSTMSVAQHTFALALYLYEKLPYYDNFVKSGKYSATDLFTHMGRTFHELDGKVWGIFGLGAIGKKVAEIAGTFGCHIIYTSSTGKNTSGEYECVDFDTLLAQSDILSIHAPLHGKDKSIFNYSAFSKMKRDALLINVARGPIVNQADLAKALDDGLIAGAGIDVFDTEPIASDDPLLRIKDSSKLIMTPHIAWATVEARTRCLDEVYNNISTWKKENGVS